MLRKRASQAKKNNVPLALLLRTEEFIEWWILMREAMQPVASMILSVEIIIKLYLLI